jgi:D-alanyl-D-alanine carboxypeptidase
MRKSRLIFLCAVAVLSFTACAPSITPIAGNNGPIPASPPVTEPVTPSHAESEESLAAQEQGVAETDQQHDEALPESSPHESISSKWSAVRLAIDSALNQPYFRTAMWGVLVLNEHGDTMYARNPEKLLVPASNMKIVTGAVALAQLGPNFRFRNNALSLGLRDPAPKDFGPPYDTVWLRNRPLRDVLPTMLKQSQNRLAEQIFKTIGLEGTGSPLRDSSVAVINRQLAEWQIPRDGYIVYDGSGYDRANYLSAETITRILFVMRNDSTFVNALPVAGVDGTLVRRMRATSAMGNAYAKTGSLYSIRSLSGYVTTMSGEQLIFSMICNAYTIPANVVTSAMDSIVARLADMAEQR